MKRRKNSVVKPEVLDDGDELNRDDDSFKEAKFNAGMSKLDRINLLRIYIINCKVRGDDKNQLSLLSSYYTELSERMTDEEKKKADEFENKLKFLVETELDADYTLNQFYRFLASVEHKYGLGLPDAKREDLGKAVLK